MKLYIAPGSPNCRKVQATARALGIDLEETVVDFQSGTHHGPEFLAMNPNGTVPVLTDGDLTLWESNAISQYLVDRHGDTPLWPRDAARRADVSRWQC